MAQCTAGLSLDLYTVPLLLQIYVLTDCDYIYWLHTAGMSVSVN